MDLQTLMAKIRQVESSGRYGITNSIGALGAYQIMRGNLPSWSRQALGRTVSESEFLRSPDIQDQIAGYILGGYLKQYGAEGAAAMWFSDQPNPNSKASDGGNTVRQYVDKVMGASGSGGGSASITKTMKTIGGGSTPSIDPSVLAQQYGLVQQLIDSVPELKAKFNQAIKEGWTADKFKAVLTNTNWWKSTNETQRQYLIKSITDPATFQRDRDAQKYRIGELGNQLGFWSLLGNKQLTDYLVYGVMYNGWSDAQLKYEMGNFLSFSPEGGLAGAGGQFQTKMSQMAWSNGIKLDEMWYYNNYKAILQGRMTEEQAQRDIRNRAAAMFPAFKDQILAGQNVADLASPYMQSMGSILEINPSTLDLFDPTIKNALNFKDAKTGITGAKPLWQYENDLRKDPRWLKTNNAREGLMGVAHKVATDMGVMY